MGSSYISGSPNGKTQHIKLIGGEKFELFNEESTSEYSGVVEVNEWSALFLCAFGLLHDQQIIVHKVLLKDNEPPSGEPCTSKIDVYPEVEILSEHSISCDAIKLTKCRDIGYLVTPGNYRFEIPTDAVGEVKLVARSLTDFMRLQLTPGLILENNWEPDQACCDADPQEPPLGV